MRSKKDQQLLEALEATACSHGFDLVDIERAGLGKHSLLRVFIDREEGLSLDDVAAANEWINEVVEALDPYKGSYTLEISSPGIDRPLRTLRHFERAVGEEAIIVMESVPELERESDAGTKPRLKYTGLITGVDAQSKTITLEIEGAIHELEFENIRKARVKGHLDFEGKKTQ